MSSRSCDSVTHNLDCLQRLLCALALQTLPVFINKANDCRTSCAGIAGIVGKVPLSMRPYQTPNAIADFPAGETRVHDAAVCVCADDVPVPILSHCSRQTRDKSLPFAPLAYINKRKNVESIPPCSDHIPAMHQCIKEGGHLAYTHTPHSYRA